MKHTLLALLSFILLPLRVVLGEDSHADPMAGAFFPPELVLQARDLIGLSPEQLKELRTRVDEIQPRSEELRKQLDRETAALALYAKQEHVDKVALLAQLDKVLGTEHDLKHLHLGLLAGIKNLLTPEQQAKLRGMPKEGGPKLAEEMRQRLTEKVERVKAGVQAWVASGRDPSAIAHEMETKFKPLIEAGKATEAEAELDRILEQLKTEPK